MKIIELSGLPGCGKSTIVTEIEKNFQKQKLLTIQNLSQDRKKFLNNKYLQFLMDVFSLKNLNVNFLIILYTFSYKVTKERLGRITKSIIFNAKLYEKSKEENQEYLVLDQGIIVLLTSIPHENIIKENLIFISLVKALKRKYKNTLFINCTLDKKKVIQQIRMRNKEGHRFDSLSAEMLENLLDIRKYNLELVQKYLQADSKVLVLDMKVENEINVEKILKFIN